MNPFYEGPFRRLGNRFRRKRLQLLLDRLARIDRPVHILDVGGYEDFWVQMHFDLDRHRLTILNLPGEVSAAKSPHVTCVEGDACDMRSMARGEFDIVFSNSVIEHVGDWKRQQAMASEVRRLSDRYFVQTPNYHFPLEPHFHFPWFQVLPVTVKTKLIQHFALGMMPRLPDGPTAFGETQHTLRLSVWRTNQRWRISKHCAN